MNVLQQNITNKITSGDAEVRGDRIAMVSLLSRAGGTVEEAIAEDVDDHSILQTTMSISTIPSLLPSALALTIDRATFERLCCRREVLRQELFDAPAQSILAIDLCQKLSIVTAVVDEYMQIHSTDLNVVGNGMARRG